MKKKKLSQTSNKERPQPTALYRRWSTRQAESSTMKVSYDFFFSSRRRHTRWTGDWSSDVCSSDLNRLEQHLHARRELPIAGDPRIDDDETLPDARRRPFRVQKRSEERRVGKE